MKEMVWVKVNPDSLLYAGRIVQVEIDPEFGINFLGKGLPGGIWGVMIASPHTGSYQPIPVNDVGGYDPVRGKLLRLHPGPRWYRKKIETS